jgi:hypothetical protein
MAALLGTWKTDSSTAENYDAWAKQSGRNFVSMIICIFKIFRYTFADNNYFFLFLDMVMVLSATFNNIAAKS